MTDTTTTPDQATTPVTAPDTGLLQTLHDDLTTAIQKLEGIEHAIAADIKADLEAAIAKVKANL